LRYFWQLIKEKFNSWYLEIFSPVSRFSYLQEHLMAGHFVTPRGAIVGFGNEGGNQ